MSSLCSAQKKVKHIFLHTSLKKKKNTTRKFGSQNAVRACNWKHTFFFNYLALKVKQALVNVK